MTDATNDEAETRVYARKPDGSIVDVTEGVQALYDHCVSSMDWGSGFLDVEDARGIIRIAQTCGFLMPDTAAAEFEQYARNEGRSANSNIICAECGERVIYSYGWQNHPGGAGWLHADHNPNHEVRLWR